MRLVEGRADIADLDAFLEDIGEIADEFDCAIQAFDADYVVGESHLRTAVERADRAFDRGENVARERAVEILLYAAGRRQIDRALRMGVGEGESDVVVVVHSPTGDAESERAAAEAVSDLLAPAPAEAGADEERARARPRARSRPTASTARESGSSST
ncbi:KEOPS complex subunit Cgi121 [Halorussus caseinilyticus]|uniref:KEOPS complex subunit Cgi121 n=1 Tax=Halorussus caseinilyticus TaxID=3034025 RepID=A0ABD5WRX0_9EURY